MAENSHIKRTLFGVGRSIVVYRCRHCAAKLKSPLVEAGTTDTCPACGAAFVVPGADERDRLRNEKLAKQEAKRALAEAKCHEKAKAVSTDDVRLSESDIPPPHTGKRRRIRLIATFATAASLALLALVGIAFHFGRESALTVAKIEPQPTVLDPSFLQPSQESSITPLKSKTAEPKSKNAAKWWENDPVVGGDKNAAEHRTIDTRHLIAAAEESVVTLKVSLRDESATAAGSGFVLRSGVVVTNYHVVEDAATVLVKFKNGRESYSTGYLAASKENDLALVKCDTAGCNPLPLGALPEKLDQVFAIGSPHGVYSGTISNGIVSGMVERKQKKPPANNSGSFAGPAESAPTVMIQTTAPISPGNSGGPLLNEKGEVVGVTTSTLTDAQNVNFAVVAAHVEKLLASAQNVARPWRELPDSVASMRRADLRQLEARVSAAAKAASEAQVQVNETNREYVEAWQQVRAASNEVDALRERNKKRIAAGLTPEDMSFSDEWQKFLEVTEKRNRLSDTLKQERKQYEESLRKFETLRQQYEELRQKQEHE